MALIPLSFWYWTSNMTFVLALIGYLAIGFVVGVWFRSEAPKFDTRQEINVAVCAKLTILIWPVVFLLVAVFKVSDKLEVWQADLAEKWFTERKKKNS